MEDFETEVTTAAQLTELLAGLPPDVRIVSDVGASMFSGWGTLRRATYYAKDNTLELIFS